MLLMVLVSPEFPVAGWRPRYLHWSAQKRQWPSII